MRRDSSDERTVVWPDNTVWLASYPRSGNTYLGSIEPEAGRQTFTAAFVAAIKEWLQRRQ